MSWSFSAIGTPENLSKALDAESAKMSGQSKVEFDDAVPHIKGALAQNFSDGTYGPVNSMHVEASGSGSAKDGKQIQRSMSLKITYAPARVV